MKEASDRLDKVLANNGIGSRKDVKRLVRQGYVSVNGVVVTNPEMHICMERDKVVVDGEELKAKRNVYVMMNKAAGTVCSTKSGPHATVFDGLDEYYRGKFLGGEIATVGRLDVDTEGLLILTTDGELNHRLTSPRYSVSKIYAVRLRDSVSEAEQARYAAELSAGMHIEAEDNAPAADCLPAEISWQGDDSCLLTVSEGKYHEVKRLFSALGNEVVHLKRVQIGSLHLDESLASGAYRELTDDECKTLGVM